MKNKQLKITVSGFTGSGKSTIAQFITKALADAGFDPIVEVIDDVFSIDFVSEHLQKERLEKVLESKPEIIVEEIKLYRKMPAVSK